MKLRQTLAIIQALGFFSLNKCGAAVDLDVRGVLGGCPLCEAYDDCLEACYDARHDQQPDKVNMRGSYSRFCMQRCQNAEPGHVLPAEGFKGPEPPPYEQVAQTWYEKMSAFLR
eukprot:gnl/MRDRNA2_/MRDRNA2_29900_c0_seq1.p1 gnl/MRDRNA2_/MRDRNA2_29900_c0~~gnl/MRDRNA2_/MRDRNA2_29900_c0_seq1.p1  ORF type:complete len:114 (+),score=17.29 gnl/MRDRNA2_/MRDRNA2_29900_c0_seq1:41-382(+)